MTAPIKDMTPADNDASAGATVSAGYAAHLFRFAVARGADAARLTAASGVAPAALEDPDARVALSRYVALMRAAKALTGDPALALKLGAVTDLRAISVVGLICYAASTMGEGLAELNRFGRLVAQVDVPADGQRFRVEPRDNGLWLTDTRRDPDAFPELTEETWARFIAETARHFPEASFARAVHVTHPAPAHAAEYERLFGAPVSFGSAHNAVMIDPSWLDLPLHAPNRYVFGVLSAHAQALLDSLADADDLPRRVERLLVPVLHKGDPGMDAVARDLGMSGATLYRRLREAGTGYDALLDDLRHRMALHYLDGRKVSVAETAYLVGFSEPSAFSRAFKRWTGSSPRRR
jgi:AraC-like DNA-binding protein